MDNAQFCTTYFSQILSIVGGGGGNKVGLNILSVSKKSKTNLSKVIAESIFYSYFAKYKEKEI